MHFILMIINSIFLLVPLTYLLISGITALLLGRFCPKTKRYGINLLLAADQAANTILLGHEDETISSRCGRAIKSGRPMFFAKYLGLTINLVVKVFTGHPTHCQDWAEDTSMRRDDLWKWH